MPSPSSPDLTRFFAPRAVALIGATDDLTKFGGRCMRQMIDFGYQGPIYPVNPKRSEVMGLRCYPSLSDVPQAPDHVAIVLPAAACSGAIAECGRMGVPYATVFSSGFTETGTPDGRALQAELVGAARAAGVRFMGPNCNGMINFVDGFALTSTATITGPRRPSGDVAVISQSGGAGQVNTMWRAQEAGLGISYQVSCGNDADLDLLDYVTFALESSMTRVVLVIAEKITDGAKLRRVAARAAELAKPIIMIKIGRTEAGARAAASHTGAITGSDAVFDAAARQIGILRATDSAELYEAAMLLRGGKLPGGRCAAAMSISGGNLVLMAEIGATLGLEFPSYTDATLAALKPLLPGFMGAANPTDLSAGAIGQKDLFGRVARTVLEDAHVDTLVPVVTFAPRADIRATADLAAASPKPVPILWTGKCSDDTALTPATLVAEGHAVYRDVLPCLRAVDHAVRYAAFQARRRRPAPPRPDGIDADAARRLLHDAGGTTLSESRSKALLRHYGLPMTREVLAKDAASAIRAAMSMAGPVALKVQSPDLPHKTEAGAIALHVEGVSAIGKAYEAITASALRYKPDACIEGVLVQEMVTGGTEMLLGITADPTFGPVLTLGFGGIHVEVLRDVAHRLPPITIDEAHEALHELRLFPLLRGVRGAPPGDLDALVDAILRFSWLAHDLGDRLAEVDVNPLVVLPHGRGVRVVDALVVTA